MANEPAFLSINYFEGDGVTVTREINFAGGYIQPSHVRALEIDADENQKPVLFDFAGSSTIVLKQPTPEGSILKVYRTTPNDLPLVDFSDGSGITEINLDDNAKQAVFLSAEAADIANDFGSSLNARAIVVPRGEVAPTMPPRRDLLNKLLGIGSDGNIRGITIGGTDGTGLDTSVIGHNGSNLFIILDELIAKYSLTAGEVEFLAQDIVDSATDRELINTKLTALTTDFEDLQGIVDDITDITTPGTLAFLIAEESSARVDGDSALAATIGVIGAKSLNGAAFILNTDTVKVSPTETLSERFSAINAVTTDALAQITTERQARIAADLVEATARDNLGVSVRDELGAAVTSERNARIAGDTAEASARAALAATLLDEAAALVTAEQNARVTADTAEATQRGLVAAEIRGEVAAQFVTEQTARVAGDNAIATDLALLGASNAAGTAFIIDYDTVQIGVAETLAQRISGITATAAQAATDAGDALSKITLANAAIAAEEQARVDAISAEASSRSSLGASLTTIITNEIAAEETARIDGDTAEGAARIAAIQAEALARGQLATTLRQETTAAVQAETNARVTAVSAEATARTNVVATLRSETTAAVTVETNARVTGVNSALTRWALKLDSNNHVVGMEFNNSAQTSNLIINVNNFELNTPAGNRKIFGANIDGVTLGSDLFMGAGRIVSKAGGFMKVQGTGFGVGNEFIEWFGPERAIAACDRLSAKSYLTKDGDAYFGGSLSAGTLSNNGATSLTTVGANVTVGPFGTNGNPVVVILSYLYTTRSDEAYNPTTAGVTAFTNRATALGATSNGLEYTASGTRTGTIKAELRRLGVLVGTLTISAGSWSWSGSRPIPAGGEPGYARYSETWAGSITYTDNAGGTSDRTFSAQLVTRTVELSGTVQQRLSIHTSEE